MKNYLTVVTALLVLNGAGMQNPIKKYDVKSGIVTFEQVIKIGTMEVKKKLVVLFDDYGMKECKETYAGDKLEDSYFSDGKELYLVKHASKTAYKRGAAFRGTELRVEWSEFGTEEDRRSGKFKKLPAMKVADKICETYEYDDGKGSVTHYGGWNKIMLYLNVNTKGMESTQRALKVEENAKVAAEKFKVPAGFAVQ